MFGLRTGKGGRSPRGLDHGNDRVAEFTALIPSQLHDTVLAGKTYWPTEKANLVANAGGKGLGGSFGLP